MPSQKQLEMGMRLKRVAKAAGFTSTEIGGRVGVEGGTVRGWWRGYSQPDAEKLRLYAAACRVSVDYLVGNDPPHAPAGTLQEWRLRFAELVRAGVDPAEALDRISVPSPVGLTEAERQTLTGAGPGMQAALEEEAAGRWSDLTADQQEAVLRLIETMAQGNRRDTGA